jgi:hypothetical protein
LPAPLQTIAFSSSRLRSHSIASPSCIFPGMAGALSVHSRHSARAWRVASLQEIAFGGCKPSSAAQKAGGVATIPSVGW